MTRLGDLLNAKYKGGKVIKNDSQSSCISNSVDDNAFTGVRLSENNLLSEKKFTGPAGSINKCQFTENVEIKATYIFNIRVSVGKGIF